MFLGELAEMCGARTQSYSPSICVACITRSMDPLTAGAYTGQTQGVLYDFPLGSTYLFYSPAYTTMTNREKRENRFFTKAGKNLSCCSLSVHHSTAANMWKRNRGCPALAVLEKHDEREKDTSMSSAISWYTSYIYWERDWVDEAHEEVKPGGQALRIVRRIGDHVRNWMVIGTPFESSDQMMYWIKALEISSDWNKPSRSDTWELQREYKGRFIRMWVFNGEKEEWMYSSTYNGGRKKGRGTHPCVPQLSKRIRRIRKTRNAYISPARGRRKGCTQVHQQFWFYTSTR